MSGFVTVQYLPLWVKGAGSLHNLQDDLQCLSRHVAVLAGHAVDVEHRPVARQAGGGDAEIQPAFGEMIEHRHAVGEFGGMMIGQQKPPGPMRMFFVCSSA